MHVTLRVCCHVPELRTPAVYHATRSVLAGYLDRDDLRFAHVSIQRNHFHLLPEPRDANAFSTAMQGFVPSLAKAINAATGHTGRVFEHRCHARAIETPRQARNAIAYVLNNWRRHEEDLKTAAAFGVALDPYLSGYSFDGWKEHGRIALPPGYTPLPVSPPRTSLLAREWRRFGLISCFEVPGPLR